MNVHMKRKVDIVILVDILYLFFADDDAYGHLIDRCAVGGCNNKELYKKFNCQDWEDKNNHTKPYGEANYNGNEYTTLHPITKYICEYCKGEYFVNHSDHYCQFDPKYKTCLTCQHHKIHRPDENSDTCILLCHIPDGKKIIIERSNIGRDFEVRWHCKEWKIKEEK